MTHSPYYNPARRSYAFKLFGIRPDGVTFEIDPDRIIIGQRFASLVIKPARGGKSLRKLTEWVNEFGNGLLVAEPV